MVSEINLSSGQPMQSAAKAPYLATFRVRYMGIKKLEEEACKMQFENNQNNKKEDGNNANDNNINASKNDTWKSAIFKVGDDCRQDMLALQIMELFKYIYKNNGLDLYLFPYKVVATMPGVSFSLQIFYFFKASLFRNKRFMLDEMTWRNASKFV